jgi:uncharacterized protein YbaR (Trm112 family)
VHPVACPRRKQPLAVEREQREPDRPAERDGGWVVWLVAPFCATVGYVLLLAGEMGVAQALRR